MKARPFQPEKSRLLLGVLVGLLVGALLISAFFRGGVSPIIYKLTGSRTQSGADYSPTPIQLRAILHYATSTVTPQQSLAEISVSFEVLKAVSPCNFLVFGLGHDSLMWAALNPGGFTQFLEEDPKWIQAVLKDQAFLNAYAVRYNTKLSEADELLSSYNSVPQCGVARATVRGNTHCRLALSNLPDNIYDKEWDVIMIDAPRGYFPEAPGRMGAIYSAAVMARSRRKAGLTHVFLHDVNRRVERVYAKEFLCLKYLVNAVGRLWHFQIPPAENATGGTSFC